MPVRVMEEKRILNDGTVGQAAGGKGSRLVYVGYNVKQDCCTGCQGCLEVCPAQCISFGPFASINRSFCVQCGSCANFCPACAIEWVEETVEE